RAEADARLHKRRLEALVQLNLMCDAGLEDMAAFALEQGIELTGSRVGFLGLMAEDGSGLTLHAWSRNVLDICGIPGDRPHLPVAQAGLWAECVRRRKPLIFNDYQAPGLPRGGLPGGHTPLTRLACVPVLEGGRVVLVATVGNKGEDYESADVIQLELLLSGMWNLLKRQRDREELRAAMLRAEAASRAKTRFLSTVSHEVRTPLNGVLGMLQLLESSGLTETQRDYVATALDAGQGLLGIINDILDLTRIEAGRLDLVQESFDPKLLGELVSGAFRAAAGQRGLRLGFTPGAGLPARLLGDEGRLRQVLFNLVNNAVKFTEQGEVAVAADWEPEPPDRGRLVLTVRDTGPGIPEDRVEEMFEPFTQLDGGLTRRHSGTGLGLSIVRRLVEAMQGAVRLGPAPGGGLLARVSV
ncbi:MAG: GAF domain-containing sensor histidine kinase, partial [Desulfovibrionaceae bacterium]